MSGRAREAQQAQQEMLEDDCECSTEDVGSEIDFVGAADAKNIFLAHRFAHTVSVRLGFSRPPLSMDTTSKETTGLLLDGISKTVPTVPSG